MHSFLISDRSQVTNTQSPDVLIIEPDGSIGIEDVREIQKFLSRKPVSSDHNTVYVINAHLLTIPAQNALLKILEEPPGKSQIYLITAYPDLLIDTVLSRVQIKNSVEQSQTIDLEKVDKIMKKVLTSTPAQRLLLVDELGFNRDQALKFIEELEYWLHHNLDKKINYAAVAKTRKYLIANVNVKLSMDFLCLNLSG
jgi:DNA polymerase III subunit gamma/tau